MAHSQGWALYWAWSWTPGPTAIMLLVMVVPPVVAEIAMRQRR